MQTAWLIMWKYKHYQINDDWGKRLIFKFFADDSDKIPTNDIFDSHYEEGIKDFDLSGLSYKSLIANILIADEISCLGIKRSSLLNSLIPAMRVAQNAKLWI